MQQTDSTQQTDSMQQNADKSKVHDCWILNIANVVYVVVLAAIYTPQTHMQERQSAGNARSVVRLL
jgi:hypothetical protein